MAHSVESYRAAADRAHAYCDECRMKMRTKPQSRMSYEHLHDQTMADAFFNDACAREFNKDKSKMKDVLKSHGIYLREKRVAANTAIVPERFYDYYDRLVNNFNSE